MKLVTLIPPRRDGTVIVRDGDAMFVFRPDERTGELSCDIPIVGGLAARLLAGGLFEPADAADHDVAARLLGVEDDGGSEAAPEPPTEAEQPVRRRRGRPPRERPPQ